MIHANDRESGATVMRADRLYPIALMVWFFVAYALGQDHGPHGAPRWIYKEPHKCAHIFSPTTCS